MFASCDSHRFAAEHPRSDRGIVWRQRASSHTGLYLQSRGFLEVRVARLFFAAGGRAADTRFDMATTLLADDPVHHLARDRIRTVALYQRRRRYNDPPPAGNAHAEEVTVRCRVAGEDWEGTGERAVRHGAERPNEKGPRWQPFHVPALKLSSGQ